MNVSEVRFFVGICSYYRRFIKGFLLIVKFFFKLIEKGREFKWLNECQVVFEELKCCLIIVLIFCYLDFLLLFVVDIDVSQFGLGVVLLQEIEGKLWVIVYVSRILLKLECWYCVICKEFLVVVFVFKYFCYYLYGYKVVVCIDYSVFKWFLNFKDLQG